jgi:hypothetical protein
MVDERLVARRRKDYSGENSREVMCVAFRDRHSLRPQSNDLICVNDDHHLTKGFGESPLVELPAGVVKEKLRKFPGDLGNNLVELFACHVTSFIAGLRQADPVARSDARWERSCRSGLRPKASVAAGEAADGGEARHQPGADFYRFDPTGFD